MIATEYLPAIVISDLFFQKRNLCSKYYHDHHFTDEETEVEEGYLLCQAWSHN